MDISLWRSFSSHGEISIKNSKVIQRMQPSKKQETRDKYKKEFLDRTIMEIAGNLGFLPFYKDIRTKVIKDLYEDKDKGKLTLTDAEKKKYMPKVYKKEKLLKKRFEKTSAYRNQQKMKARKKQQRQKMLKKIFGK